MLNTLEKLKDCKGKKIAIDLDMTLSVDEVQNFMNKTYIELMPEFAALKPNKKMIDLCNRLYMAGNEVTIFTSRGLYLREITESWLVGNQVLYSHLIMNKPFYDWMIDDKAIGEVLNDDKK